ncbi:MAG: hypothetical protein U5K76_06410 [Woeseiaceae bacterium]|nr:hypothetical protein [Woeseiaceae bacterium]
MTPLGAISRRYLADETRLVEELAGAADGGDATRKLVRDTAVALVEAVRRDSANEGGIDAFLQQYDLSSEEGVLLMCALPRHCCESRMPIPPIA